MRFINGPHIVWIADPLFQESVVPTVRYQYGTCDLYRQTKVDNLNI